MKILSPLNANNIDEFIDAGVDEFYAGFYDEAWNQKFGDFADLNRMSGFKRRANQYSFGELMMLAETVIKRGVGFYVTLNAPSYSQKQLMELDFFMKEIARAGCSGVIVSCPEAVRLAVNNSVVPVASTMCGIFNSSIAKFYRDLGCKRIILPRDITLDNIARIIDKTPDVEYEVFLMRNGCVFADSNCLTVHRVECGSLCGALRHSDHNFVSIHNDFVSRHNIELNNMLYTDCYKVFACGLCAIYRFLQLGVHAGKIVGRADEIEYLCRDIRLAKENISIAVSCSTEHEYLEKMIFPENNRVMCKCGFSCYYPELRFDSI